MTTMGLLETLYTPISWSEYAAQRSPTHSVASSLSNSPPRLPFPRARLAHRVALRAHACARASPSAPAEDGTETVLPIGAGYAIVLGFGTCSRTIERTLSTTDTDPRADSPRLFARASRAQ